jgi:hypothetical protein
MDIVVMMTTVTILMKYYATKNYLIQKSLGDVTLVIVIYHAWLSSDKSILQKEHTMIDGTETQDSTLN